MRIQAAQQGIRRFLRGNVLAWMGLSGLCLLYISGFQPARADSFWDSFVPSEVIETDDLRQKVHIPSMVDINAGTLNQLKTLPGFDEEIALKAMRSRPFFSIQDFYGKMPGLDEKILARLVKQIQFKVVFNRPKTGI